jgi:phosphoglycerate-specific signal transduction histidine kinase
VLNGAEDGKMNVIVLMRQTTMTPEQKAALQQHVDAIGELLYADSDPEALRSLAGIETTVRAKLLEQVSPHVGSFLSTARQAQQPEDIAD